MEFLHHPFPWCVSGILIGLMVPALLIFGNKQFGISSSMRHLCAALVPGNVKYFHYDWKKESWNLFLVLGMMIGGLIASTFMSNPHNVAISEATKADLVKLGLHDFSSYIPREIFSWNNLMTLPGLLVMIVGGFLVGFGARYANGCTSGHCIMGNSLLNAGSLFSTVCFFIGGLITTWLIYPLRNCSGEKRSSIVVSHSGNVPFSIDSHVRNHGDRSGDRRTFGFLNQKIEK